MLEENLLEGSTTSPLCSTTTFTYAEMVSRNPKRTLVDRCLSPSEVPLKRSATSDIMKTPTEFKTFYPASPSCDTTPETNRCVHPGAQEGGVGYKEMPGYGAKCVSYLGMQSSSLLSLTALFSIGAVFQVKQGWFRGGCLVHKLRSRQSKQQQF